MHELALGTGVVHQCLSHLIGTQSGDALCPHLHGLTHGDPHVGVDHVGTFGGRHRVLDELQHCAGLGGDRLAGVDEGLVWEIGLGSAGHKVHAHLGAAHHQGVAHVVPGVAHIHQLDALELSEVLLDGQKVRQDLSGVELIGQAVEHRHPGVLGQLLHDGLLKSPVLDAVIHPAQHPGSVGDGLLDADLGAGRAQVGGPHAQVLGGHLKGAASAGGGLFKDEGHILALQQLVGHAGLFLGL